MVSLYFLQMELLCAGIDGGKTWSSLLENILLNKYAYRQQ